MFVCQRSEVTTTVNVGIDLSCGRRLNEKIAVLVERFLTTFCSYLGKSIKMPGRCFTREQKISESWKPSQDVHPAGSPTSFEGCHRSPTSKPPSQACRSVSGKRSVSGDFDERAQQINSRSIAGSQ
ncbi:MAG: hypothetical protein ACI8Y4_004634 [Candidatus Poriferisodalaceae bacterium]|jgi:hypothetical protein